MPPKDRRHLEERPKGASRRTYNRSAALYSPAANQFAAILFKNSTKVFSTRWCFLLGIDGCCVLRLAACLQETIADRLLAAAEAAAERTPWQVGYRGGRRTFLPARP